MNEANHVLFRDKPRVPSLLWRPSASPPLGAEQAGGDPAGDLVDIDAKRGGQAAR